MNSPRIGIVGCGAAAKRYYLPALKRYPNLLANLCLVDRNLETAQNLATELGGGRVFENYQDILGEVDGVIIAIPHFFHFEVSMDFLNAGVNVLCEKPLAETLAEVEELVKTAKKNEVSLSVNNTRRMFPNFKGVKNIIASGKMGKLRSIEFQEGSVFAWPSETGFYVNPKVSSKGVLLDIGSHVIDTISWWLGGKPELLVYEDDSFGGPESLAKVEAKFGNCKINILLNRLIELDNRFSLTFESGKLYGGIFEWGQVRTKDTAGIEKIVKFKNDAKTYPDFVIPVVDNFIKVISGEAKPLVSGEDVGYAVAVIEECYNNRKRINSEWYQNLEKIVE